MLKHHFWVPRTALSSLIMLFLSTWWEKYYYVSCLYGENVRYREIYNLPTVTQMPISKVKRRTCDICLQSLGSHGQGSPGYEKSLGLLLPLTPFPLRPHCIPVLTVFYNFWFLDSLLRLLFSLITYFNHVIQIAWVNGRVKQSPDLPGGKALSYFLLVHDRVTHYWTLFLPSYFVWLSVLLILSSPWWKFYFSWHYTCSLCLPGLLT